MNLANQFSYPIFSVAILIVGFIILRRVMNAGMRYIVLIELSLGSVMLAGFLILSPIASPIDNVAQVQAIISNGKPTFLEFFSKYCSGCLVFEPTVSELVTHIEADYNILRIDIHTAQGRELRKAYDFSFTPEFVLFNTSGIEIWRDHRPPSQQILAKAK